MAETFAESKLYIGTTAGDETNDQAAFEADNYLEIKDLSNMGAFGTSRNILKFVTVSGGFTKKSVGTADAGDPVVVAGRLPLDPGQNRLNAALGDKFYRNFKLVVADATSEHYTDSIIYFRALVAAAPKQFGGAEDFVTLSASLAIWPEPVEVPSEFVTSP